MTLPSAQAGIIISRPNAAAARGGFAARLRERWYATPVRWQILLAISLLTFLMGVVACALAMIDAGHRAGIETRANLEVWRQVISPKAKELGSSRDLPLFAAHLAIEMARVRHVTVRVLDDAGRTVTATGPNQRESPVSFSDGSVPLWFIQLVQPVRYSETIDIVSKNARVGSVVITGRPDDEIEEAWELLVKMAALWLTAIAVIMVGLYFILGLILDPLLALAGGMRKLEDGNYGIRLAAPRVKEIASIAESFNALAAALNGAEAENQRLYRQLISVQEDERRQIARDLHDEFGPCIFGITAGVGSIERYAADVPAPKGDAIRERAKEIGIITERMKSLNRALLSRLRPVALGRIALEELLAELIRGFEQRHPDVLFQSAFANLSKGFGEAIDLTIYRCIQEGLTNALKHGKPELISVTLECVRTDLGKPAKVLLDIADDGSGIVESAIPGFGISGMRERVKALAGSLQIRRSTPRGTNISIIIPCAGLPEG